MSDFLTNVKKYTTAAIAIVALILSVLTAINDALPKEAPPIVVSNQGVSNLDTLQVGDGSLTEPAFGFTADPDNGLYRIGTNNIGIAAGGTKILDVSASGASIVGTFSPSGLLNANGGIAVDTSAFTVADTSGNTQIAGTLGVTGSSTLSDASVGGGYASTGCDLTSVGNINCAGNAAIGGDATITGTTTAGTVYVNGYLRSSNGPVTAFDPFTSLKAFTATLGIVINGNTYTVTEPITITDVLTNVRLIYYQVP